MYGFDRKPSYLMRLGQTQPSREMIAVPLDELCRAAVQEQLSDLCECIKNYAQQPGVQPCGTFPFTYKGSITQLALCHTATTVFQVPKGMLSTITRVAFAERYPGTLYGATFMLVINDNLAPEFPRMDYSVGSISTPIGTRICLQDQDIVSVLVQCSWRQAVATTITSTYVQTIYPFEISGFHSFKEVVAAA